MNKEFKAIVITETEDKHFVSKVQQRDIASLPDGNLLINVKYSSLNYKDALSSIGNKGVTRNYPHTPGIDAAGLVVESSSDKFKPGDSVIVTGHDLGMNTSGGFSEYIRVPEDWVVNLPVGLSLKESMIYGTGGFTAALSVFNLIDSGVKPTDGDILVTGATGGVGSTSISILSKLGYSVYALTGKEDQKEMLINLGAKDIVHRSELDESSHKPMLKSRWAGVIDTVGGDILSNAIKETKYGGTITCCGNVASGEIETSIYPFILRGVRLIGIDSVNVDMKTRVNIWKLLSRDWKTGNLEANIKEVSLNGVGAAIEKMLDAEHTGRTIVNIEL